MITWAALDLDIRRHIDDGGAIGAQSFTPEEMETYRRSALRIFGNEFPRRDLREVPVTAGTSLYPLDDDITDLRVVEMEAALYTLEEIELVPGEQLDAEREGYMVIGSQLRLYPRPTVPDTMILHVNALWPENVLDAQTVPIPRAAHVAISYLIRMFAAEREEFSDANLSRWATANDKGGSRWDNPLTPVGDKLYKRYREQINLLRGSNNIMLVR